MIKILIIAVIAITIIIIVFHYDILWFYITSLLLLFLHDDHFIWKTRLSEHWEKNNLNQIDNKEEYVKLNEMK